MRNKMKQRIMTLLLFVLIPLLIFLGITLYEDRNYGVFSMMIAIIACIPFFYKYEKTKPQAREVVMVAIFCTMAILSRVIFAFLPAFKPVTAIIILSGMAFGREAGFMNGALTALCSNMFFGQGPWTPFQMLSWGLIGYLAGWLNQHHHLEQPRYLYPFAAFSGIFYSVLMDVWSALSIDRAFYLSRYLSLLLTSLPFMAAYVCSNIVFLAVLWKTVMRKINRIKMKYGVLRI